MYRSGSENDRLSVSPAASKRRAGLRLCVRARKHWKEITFHGKVIVASGGLNGMFGNATGSVRNTGAVSASLFADGVAFANGEFIQYHPTTVPMHGNIC